VPTILSFVIVGFAWKLILSPIWGIAPSMLDAVGLKSLFAPWLGKEEYALTTLGLISVWQFVGIPMMLIYAALLSIPTRSWKRRESTASPACRSSGRSSCR
jgi:raffinose/stachyose/melibiose transport system permease protein